jgi:hypothetical protein
MLREPEQAVARFAVSRAFKYQSVLTLKIVAGMAALFSGLWLLDSFISP